MRAVLFYPNVITMFRLLILTSAVLFSMLVSSCQETKDDPAILLGKWVEQEADSLGQTILLLTQHVESDSTHLSNEKVHRLFTKARRHYKRIEGISEFHFPGVSEAINGPALPEVDEYDDKIVEPTGFQVIEELIFPEVEVENSAQLIQELKALTSIIDKLKEQFRTNSWTEQNIFEGLRLQLFRIISLGISGFDSPIALLSIDEAKESLLGVEKALIFFSHKSTDKNFIKKLKERFSSTIRYLELSKDFNSFDRARFIVDHLNPLSEEIYSFQKMCAVKNNKWLSPFNMNESNFASAKNIQAAWFAPTHNNSLIKDSAVISLGKLLFFDPILSGNNARSCASCHKPEMAFTDGEVKSVAFNFKGSIDRNAPTIINAGFQKSQFADSRVQFLEDQVVDVISNSSEMHGQINTASERISKSEEYLKLFQQAFKVTGSNAVTPANVQVALSSFVRSLNGLNSRVDQFLEGKKQALTEGEITGFNLFMGKAKCATCHFMPLFNGSVPPTFNETESEILGVPSKPDTANAKVDTDPGKFNTYKRELHRNAFKTPTVRNVALTAPYMHNGVYKTLEEVIDFYNRGGGAGIGIELYNQTLPPEPLNLSLKEKEQLISFLHALTDTVGLTSAPQRLPKFENVKLHARKIGGNY